MLSNCCGNPNGGVICDLIDVTTLGAPAEQDSPLGMELDVLGAGREGN